MKTVDLAFLSGALTGAAATALFYALLATTVPNTQRPGPAPEPRDQPEPSGALVELHTPAEPSQGPGRMWLGAITQARPLQCRSLVDNMPMTQCRQGDPLCVCG